jgi:hypothetical protein
VGNRPQPTTISPPRWGIWADLFAAPLLVLLFGGIAVLALYELASGDFGIEWLVMLPVGVGAAIWASGRGLAALRHARKQLPVLLLDEDGLECAWGRIGWLDVARISRTHSDNDRSYVIFTLRRGTAWQPVEARYSDYTLRRRDTGEFRVAILTRTMYGTIETLHLAARESTGAATP